MLEALLRVFPWVSFWLVKIAQKGWGMSVFQRFVFWVLGVSGCFLGQFHTFYGSAWQNARLSHKVMFSKPRPQKERKEQINPAESCALGLRKAARFALFCCRCFGIVSGLCFGVWACQDLFVHCSTLLRQPRKMRGCPQKTILQSKLHAKARDSAKKLREILPKGSVFLGGQSRFLFGSGLLALGQFHT